ncbi:MAG TPA: succinate dehydrogenase cytochrome b558 subunit [Minicystis sp.]|nr:succinate dehydrogenase cytochrome b558 subunit [Minicystis sp.]
MSEAAALEKPVFQSRDHRAFLWRKLHSLSGVVPVGAFMIFHLWENATALQGQERFDEAVSGINHLPYLPFLEWGLILLPLAFHAVYGVWIALHGKPNVGRYTYSRNWMYTLQRVTGLLAFAFIGYHLWEYWGHKLAGTLAPEQFYPELCKNMSSTTAGVPIVALIYIVGISACVFHLANGLWGFCFSWGITVTRRAQRGAAVVFGVLGLVVLFLGLNTTFYFARGSTVFAARACPPAAPH